MASVGTPGHPSRTDKDLMRKLPFKMLKSTGVIVVLEYIVKILAIGIVPENRRPSSSTAWLLLILFFPAVGVPAFLTIGSPYNSARRSKIQAEANELLQLGTEGLANIPTDEDVPEPLENIVRLSRSLTALPMVHGYNGGVEMDYEASIKRMTALVNDAEETVHLEFYITVRDKTTDEFLRSMEAAVKRGVKVRVLLDHIGSRKYDGFREFLRWMSSVGIEWHLMLPFLPLQGKMRRPDLRNHRKLMVVDGMYAVMGSQNLVDSAYGSEKNAAIGRHWNDISIELSGPIVSSLESIFAVDWYSECGEITDIHAYRRLSTENQRLDSHVLESVHSSPPEDNAAVNLCQIIPSGPGFRTDPNLRVFTSMMYMARKRISIVSPYFVPDESLLAAVITAANRGVDVELYVSEQADQYMVDRAQSSYYQALLEAGVRIFMYPKPQVLHTKCFVVDDKYAVLGSSNMDMRSFGLNYEVSLLSYGGDIVTQVRDVVTTYRDKSKELDAAQWKKRSIFRKYSESVMRLTSALQ